MNSNNVRLVNGHIPESWIIRLIDEEVSAGDREIVEEHLRECTTCRSVADQYGQAIERLVEYRRIAVDPRASLSPNHQRVFEEKLNCASERLRERQKPALAQAGIFWCSLSGALMPHAKLLTCAVLIVAAIIVTFQANIGTVSAKEMLQRSAAFEQRPLHGINEPIIVQKIRICASGHESERTLYRDPRHHRQVHEINGSHAEARVIEDMLRRASLNADEVLMPERLLRMSSENEEASVSVNPGSGDPLHISVRLPHGSVRQVEVFLRANDFHITETLVHLNDSSTIEIAELSYQVVEFDALRAGLFDAPLEEKVPVTAARAVSNKAPDSTGEEIAALSALHQIHAELGDEISIDDADSRNIELEGIVENDARKHEVENVLHKFPTLRIHIETIAQKRDRLQPQVYEGQAAVSATSTSPLLEKQLKERFPAPAERQEYVRGILSYGQSASSYAWVLDELAKHFTPVRYAALRPEERKQLNYLLTDEAHSLRENIDGLSRQADSILITAAPIASGPVSRQSRDDFGQADSDIWQNQVHAMHTTLDRVNEHLSTLIVGSGPRTASADALRFETSDLLVGLSANVKQFSRHMDDRTHKALGHVGGETSIQN